MGNVQLTISWKKKSNKIHLEKTFSTKKYYFNYNNMNFTCMLKYEMSIFFNLVNFNKIVNHTKKHNILNYRLLHQKNVLENNYILSFFKFCSL